MAEDIVDVFISRAMNEKINVKHQVSEDEVRSACARVIDSYWVHDEDRGWRLYVSGYTDSGAVLIVVLYPTGRSGYWNLGTARRE
jgi:hypothetical protein